MAAVLRVECLKDLDLFDFVNSTEPDPKVAGYFFLKISEALNDFHTVFKFAHRDLKLENIMMVLHNLSIKIIDFGFAARVRDH